MSAIEDTVFEIITAPTKYSTKHFGKNRGQKTPVKWGYEIFHKGEKGRGGTIVPKLLYRRISAGISQSARK
jgi:hypothetical protein